MFSHTLFTHDIVVLVKKKHIFEIYIYVYVYAYIYIYIYIIRTFVLIYKYIIFVSYYWDKLRKLRKIMVHFRGEI